MNEENYWTRAWRRRVSRRQAILIGAGVIGTSLVAACGSPQQAPVQPSTTATGGTEGATPKRGGTVKAGFGPGVASLDAHAGISDGEHHLLFAIYDPLIRYDATLVPKPGLAEKWEFEKDTVLRLDLRKGVKFHDGTEFDAEVVKWNIERVQNPETKSTARAAISQITKVEIADKNTVRLYMDTINGAVLVNLGDRGGMMMSPAAVEKYGKDIARNPVGTGPFKFKEWVSDSHIAIERFEGYFDPKLPYLDGFRMVIIPTVEVQLANLQSGAIDLMFPSPKDLNAIKANSELKIRQDSSVGFSHLYINKAMAPMDDINARKALAYALDREAIRQAIYFGTGEVGQGPLTKASWANDPNFKGISFDKEKAKQFLKQSGYPNGFKIRNVGSPGSAIAEMMQAQAAEVGIEIQLDTMELAKWVAEMWTSQNSNINISAHQGRADPDGILWETYGPTGAYNAGKVSDPKLVDLLTQARQSYDLEKRKALYWQAQNIIVNDVHGIFWRDNLLSAAMTKKVEGFRFYGDSKPRWIDVWMNS